MVFLKEKFKINVSHRPRRRSQELLGDFYIYFYILTLAAQTMQYILIYFFCLQSLINIHRVIHRLLYVSHQIKLRALIL